MSRHVVWVSLHKLKAHEFLRTLRIVYPNLQNWPEIHNQISETQSKAITAFMKSLAPLMTIYLVFSSFGNNGEIEISIGNVNAVLPSAYVAIAGSFFFLLSTIQLLEAIVIMIFRTWLGSRIRIFGFSAAAYGLLTGKDATALGLPISLNFFLAEKLPILKIFTTLLSISFLSIFLPFGMLGYFLILEQLEVLQGAEFSIFDRMVSTFGIAIIGFAFALFFLFFLPLPYKKDRSMIRWHFLSTISKSWPHPQSAKWLDKEND